MFHISIHALVKRATRLFNLYINYPKDFNPRPREEGDSQPPLALCCGSYISIHALVKRATLLLLFVSTEIR